MPKLTLSIVSHGQGHLIIDLLADLLSVRDISFEVIVTLNIPEDERFLSGLEPFESKVIRNAQVRGFGANHNQAYAQATGQFFAIVNPDIRVSGTSFAPLVAAFEDQSIGVVAPLVLGPDGAPEDSARKFPSIRTFVSRALGYRPLEYRFESQSGDVDWVAGMFAVFKREAFEEVGGFDEAFFMYCEDADICRRLWRSGWRVAVEPKTRVIHFAQRASRKNVRHLTWFISSAFRLLWRLHFEGGRVRGHR